MSDSLLVGSLEALPFPALLRAAAKARCSGRLDLERDGFRRTLWLESGDIRHARSSDPDDRLGEWLLREGKLDRACFEAASRDVARGQRLGRWLIERGLLSADELLEHVARQIVEICVSSFEWNDGSYRFVPGDTSQLEEHGIEISTPDIVLLGVRRIRRWSRLLDIAGPLGTRYHITGEIDRITIPMDLSFQEWALLSQLAGPRSIAELTAASRLDAFALHRVLVAFWALAVVDREPAEASDPAAAGGAVEARITALVAALGAETSARIESPSVDIDLLLLDASAERQRGRLHSGKLPDLLRTIYQGRNSGALELVASDGRSIQVLFTRGAVVSARSSVPGQRVGQLLVRLGHGAAEDVERVARQGRDAAPGRELGAALVRAGVVTGEALGRALAAQVREVLLPAFDWAAGTYCFVAGSLMDPEASVPEVSTAELILAGVRQMSEIGEIVELLLAADGCFRNASDPLLAFQQIELQPGEGFLLSRFDGKTRLHDIVSLSPLSPEETCRVTYGLLCAGLLEPAVETEARTSLERDAAAAPSAPEAPVARSRARPEGVPTRAELRGLCEALPGLDAYALLGVAHSAGTDAIVDAFHRKAALYHPDRGRTPEDKQAMESIFAAVVEAYRVLRDPEERRAYDDLAEGAEPREDAPRRAPAARDDEPRRHAATLHARAREAIARKELRDAVRMLREAIALAPDEAAYLLLLGRVLAQSPKHAKEAEQALLDAQAIAPWDSAGYAALGLLCKRRGQAARAEELFHKALELNAEDEVAKRELGGAGPARVSSSLGEIVRRIVARRSA